MAQPVPKTSDNAVLLLAAAYKLGLGPNVVKSTSRGWVAPDEVLAEAGFGDDAVAQPAKAPAKRTAKKTAPKKSTAK